MKEKGGAERHLSNAMIKQHWRNLPRLPNPSDNEYQIRVRRRTVLVSKEELATRYIRWNPFITDLVSSPGSSLALPPLRERKIRRHIIERSQRISATVGSIWFAMGLLSLAIPMTNGKPPNLLPVAMLSLAMYFLSEYASLRKGCSLLLERALYFRYLANEPSVRRILLFVCAALPTIFGVQAWGESRYGPDAVLASFAMVHGELASRPYTLLTGPLLHGGSVHLVNNLVLTLVITPVVWVLYSPKVLLAAFLLANATGGAFQLAFGAAGYEAYIGISAGVCALYMLAFWAGFIRPKSLPMGLPYGMLMVVVVSTAFGDALSPTAATVAHVVGALVGLAIGMAMTTWRNLPPTWRGDSPVA